MPRADARDAERLARIERLGHGLTSRSTGHRVEFALSSRGEIGAWSWPDGRVRVSRALADLLDDAQLAAALAHELGHLLDGGHLDGAVAALSGAAGRSGPEARADVVGCALLAERGLATAALPRMLRTVAAAITAGGEGLDPAVLLQRAAAADAVCVAPR